MRRGLVHIYTGDGKGKTTAAVGLGVRAAGYGFNVLMVQFLKGGQSGELASLLKLAPNFETAQGSLVYKFVNEMNAQELTETKTKSQALFDYALKTAQAGTKDLIILDEIMAAITCGFVNEDDVLKLIQQKPVSLELALTGRNAPSGLIDAADYVMEIRPVKHPFDSGIMARIGIEF